MFIKSLSAATSVAAFFLATWLVIPLKALASANVSVEPISLKLPANTLATSVQLRSKDSRPVTFQAEVLSWQQLDGREVLGPTRELVVSPPLFVLAPGARQVVRVGRLKPELAAASEKTYRLSLTEVVSDAQVAPDRIATAIKITLPIFVPAAKPQPAALKWQVAREPGTDHLRLTASNLGNTTVKVTRLNLLQQDQLVAENKLLLYVLPGSHRSVPWKSALTSVRPGVPLELLTTLGTRKTLRQPVDVGVISVVPITAQ